MTRKDYVKIAAVFASERPKQEAPAMLHTLWTQLRHDIAQVLGDDNP